MKSKLFSLAFLFLLLACGSNKNITDRSTVVRESARKVIKNHYSNSFDKNTLSATLKVRFENEKKGQNLNVSLRLEKDKAIWLSGSFFGFTVLKALITPAKVQYYEKLGKTYFEGDFSTISNLLGKEVDYTMLQNLLLGDSMLELKSKDFDSKIDQQAHYLYPKEMSNALDFFYWIHPLNYKIEKQKIHSTQENKVLTIWYKAYQQVDKTAVPKNLEINAKSDKTNLTLSLDYKSVSVDKKLSFPYTVPSGYKRKK